MKKYNFNISLLFSIVLMVSAVLVLNSCNKALPDAEPLPKKELNPGVTQTIGDKISTDENYSIYLAVMQKTGLLPKLSNPETRFTVFAPTNEAFVRSGIPSAAMVDAMPAATVAAIGMYSVIPGHQYLAADFSTEFPSQQLPTALKIGDLPGTPLPYQMTIFPSRQNGFWVNTIPIVATDQKFANGVIHNPYAVIAPASQVLKEMIYSNPDLSYFKAAVARADSGQAEDVKFDFLLGYAATNMTLLVPNDGAMREVLFALVYAGLLEQGMPEPVAFTTAGSLTATPEVFSNPVLYEVLTPATIRGLLAYHFLAIERGSKGYRPDLRAFQNNFAPTATYYKTLVNGSIPAHPGILGEATFTSGAVTGLTFTGMGTFPPGGTPFSGEPAHVVSGNHFAVNGIYHVIDKVLFPQ